MNRNGNPSQPWNMEARRQRETHSCSSHHDEEVVILNRRCLSCCPETCVVKGANIILISCFDGAKEDFNGTAFKGFVIARRDKSLSIVKVMLSVKLSWLDAVFRGDL